MQMQMQKILGNIDVEELGNTLGTIVEGWFGFDFGDWWQQKIKIN